MEEEGEALLTLPPDMVNLDTETGKMADSSDWSGRGNRSRGSSTMSTSSANRLDELKCMTQSLAAGVQSSMQSLAAGVQSSREEQAVTSNAIATDLKRVITKVDTIEVVGATKKVLEKTISRLRKVEEDIQEHAKKIQLMEEEIAKIKTGEISERITRRRKSMESDLGEVQGTMVTHVHHTQWVGWTGTGRWTR